MDMQTTNIVLFVAVGVLLVLIVAMTIQKNRFLDREQDLKLKVKRLNADLLTAVSNKNYAETDLEQERGKLEKINLLNFSAWLFLDEEFVTLMKAKVDELRPAALERYNAKKQEESRLRAEESAASMKRFQEHVQKNREASEAREKEQKPGGGDMGMTVPVVTDTSSFSFSSDSCSVDSSC